ncbi:hypothetical protein BSKO_05863 [Bryopsis sp. KO-2023]|nr:hypothetical protein BSKO_05863 [Bryopsis sp. KO-2023]
MPCKPSIRRGIHTLLLLVVAAEEYIGQNRQGRQPLELTSSGTIFNVRSVDDFKQALLLNSVTQINLFQDVWITEAEWKDFVVPMVAREVVVEPDKTLVEAGITPQLFTDGLIVQNGYVRIESVHAVDAAEWRIENGKARGVPFFDVQDGGILEFRSTYFGMKNSCAAMGGIQTLTAISMDFCVVEDCEILAQEDSQFVIVNRARFSGSVLNGVEISNIDFLLEQCNLESWEEFTQVGDSRAANITEVQEDKIAYGSEWEYMVPSEVVFVQIAPQTKLSLMNTRLLCDECSPLSFSKYGVVLMRSNISHFQDLSGNPGDVATDGMTTGVQPQIRYRVGDNNMVVKTGPNSILFEKMTLEKHYQVFSSSAALNMENVTLSCGRFVTVT